MTNKSKYAILMPLSLALLSLANKVALAQAKCTLNGKEVPCQQIKGFLGFGFGLLAVVLILAIAAGIFWILMLVHAASHEMENKAVWIILIVFTGIIGALIYYFVVKRKFHSRTPPVPPLQ